MIARCYKARPLFVRASDLGSLDDKFDVGHEGGVEGRLGVAKEMVVLWPEQAMGALYKTAQIRISQRQAEAFGNRDHLNSKGAVEKIDSIRCRRGRETEKKQQHVQRFNEGGKAVPFHWAGHECWVIAECSAMGDPELDAIWTLIKETQPARRARPRPGSGCRGMP